MDKTTTDSDYNSSLAWSCFEIFLSKEHYRTLRWAFWKVRTKNVPSGCIEANFGR